MNCYATVHLYMSYFKTIFFFVAAKVNVLFEEDSSVVDFYPSTGTAVVYITEGDLVAGNMYRRRLAKLRKVGYSEIN